MKVSDVCDLVNGRAFKPSDWGSYGLPIVRIQNLNNESAPFNYYSGEYNPAHEINDGELLFSWSGTPGTSFGAFRWYRGKGILNQHIYKVVPKINIDKDYLKYALNGNLARIISKAHGGVGLQHITKKELNEITLRIVSNDEQRKIVELLNQTQNVINARRTQLAKLDELVRCRFVEMFGNPANNSKNWVTKPLRDCLSSIDGGKSFVCQPSARTRDWPAILKLSAITSGFYQPNENKAVIDNEHFSTSAEVKAGDLLFTRKNTPELVGISAYVYHSPVKLMIPDLIFRLNTNENCNKIFLWKLINHELFRSSISAIATGSAKSMSNISQERLLKLHIICPPVEQQNAFAAFVRRIDKLRV